MKTLNNQLTRRYNLLKSIEPGIRNDYIFPVMKEHINDILSRFEVGHSKIDFNIRIYKPSDSSEYKLYILCNNNYTRKCLLDVEVYLKFKAL